MRVNYKKYLYLAITVVVCIFIGVQIGNNISEKENLQFEEEIMMKMIGIKLSNVNTYLSSVADHTDMFTYKEYAELVNEINELSTTLDIASEVLYSKNGVGFHLLSEALDISTYIFGGMDLNDEIISNDFFADDIINEDEQRYIIELSEDMQTIVDDYENNKEHNYDVSVFEDAFKPFTDKYTIGNELLNLKVNN